MNQNLQAEFAIFDMDGLLLNTEIFYTQVTQKIVGRYGKTYDWSIKSNMIGRPAIESARYLIENLELPLSAEEYLEERNALLLKAFPECEPMPGAEHLIQTLSKNCIPIAVATSSDRSFYKVKTSRHQNWVELFDVIVTGDDPDISRGKPAPDIFNIAAKRLGAVAESTLVFEDAPSGLAAGVAANMRVIAVPDPNMDKDRYSEADLVLDSLEDFDPQDYGIPTSS